MKQFFHSIAFFSILLVSTSTFSQKEYFQYSESLDDPYIPANKNSGTSPAYIIQDGNFTSIQVNTNENGENILGDAANEPSIAINPLNPNEIVIAWRQFDNVIGNFRQAGFAYSIDGGLTWTNKGPLDPFVFRSDPVLDVDGTGTFYFNSLSLEDHNKMTGFFTDIFKSTEIGAWDEGHFAYGGDKQWMAVDKTSSEHIKVFNQWSSRFSSCDGDFTYSRDGAETFESCLVTGVFSFWGTLAIGLDGDLFSAGLELDNSVVVSRYLNATGTTDLAAPITSNISGLGSPPSSRIEVNPAGFLGQVEIEVNHSLGPYNGEVYVVNTARNINNGDQSDILFSKSMDDGRTWTNPRRLNDDSGLFAVQWFGTMSCAPNGRIDVFWLDNRQNDDDPHSALFYTFSVDGGESWSSNQRLSEYFNPQVGWPNQAKMGDYFHSLSDEDGAHIAWAGTFNGEQDVYYGYVTPDLTTPTEDVNLSSLQAYIQPNPINQNSKLRIKNNENRPIKLSLYNLLGKQIVEPHTFQTIEEIGVNLNELFDTQLLKAGAYLLIIELEDKEYIIERFIKL